MKNALADIWHELREKRLWPIALVLVLAIVAIPVLLTQSAAQTPSDGVASLPGMAQQQQIAVQLDGEDAASTGAGSSLDGFAEGDPFTPPAAIARKGGSDGSASTAGPTGDSMGAGGGVGGIDIPSGSPTPPVEVVPPTSRTETAEYQYVADVTFWTGDRRRQIQGLRKLDMLPSQSAPVLIFMGTSGEGGNAVFLVDSTLKAAGEGHCIPSAANCAYVQVGPGSEHAFTTETGDSYRLRVDEIRRVKVNAAAAQVARPTAGASGAAVRRFELPSLIDLVEVTTTTTTSGGTQPAEPVASAPKSEPTPRPSAKQTQPSVAKPARNRASKAAKHAAKKDPAGVASRSSDRKDGR